MLGWLFALVPLLYPPYAAHTLRRAGPRRLWRDASLLAAAAGVLALVESHVMLARVEPPPGFEGLGGAGVDSWVLPAGIAASAAVVQLLELLGRRRLPVLVAALAGVVVAFAVQLSAWVEY